MLAQDCSARDFYAVLDVPDDCTDDTLKRAYRRLARQYHPDTNAGCSTAERRFKEINEAYTVLSDEGLRYEYDRGRSRRPAPAPTRSAPGGGADVVSSPFGGWSAMWCSPAIWTTVVWSTMARSAAPTPWSGRRWASGARPA